MEELSDNIMSTKHHLVVMAVGLPACPECHLPAQSVTARLCQCHCPAVPASLPGCAQVPAKFFPASYQALPSSLPSFDQCQVLPRSLSSYAQISTRLISRPCPAHFQAFSRSPPSFAQLIARPCPAYLSKVPKTAPEPTMGVVFFTAD